MSNVFIVKVDKNAFKEGVKSLLDPVLVAKVQESAEEVLHLKYPEALRPPQLWDTFGKLRSLIEVICAAVEVMKQKYINGTASPNGEVVKFDKALALETAVELLDDLLVFDGWVGAIIDKIDAPVLNLCISMYISGKSANWLNEALHILGK